MPVSYTHLDVYKRQAQYETQYISRKKALAQLAEAKQGFLVRKEEGDETAQSLSLIHI